MVAPGTSATGGRCGEDAIPVSKFTSCRFYLKSKGCTNKTLKPLKLESFKADLKRKLTSTEVKRFPLPKSNGTWGAYLCSLAHG
jgi:hypothetical protein